MKFMGTLFDVTMIFLTGGLWIIWILVRWIRANS